ncbi:MAG TPA: 2-succinyl-5-enolpyruvyl-6-hydroxy-3-cyclohexene-1-carboxylic-acid synthase [Lactobacillaceae bacterium]|jgi:2-succinyl-5-enolpyruvyl-6-hydroxy-3-cyclohexene-1-carboxylate synthase
MHTAELLADNIHHLISALQASGVRDVVISPGSRSTPVALMFAERAAHDDTLALYVDVDERSAAFFALGLAKTAQRPVVLLSTSGTAAANYYPAIVEAAISHVPLIALTTDRPSELQNVGAPQTIDQTHLYGHYAKAFVNVNLQDDHQDVTSYIDFRVQTAIKQATAAPAGPIQINLPLRKPLMPAFNRQVPAVLPLQTTADSTPNLDWLAELAAKKVLVVAGPAETTKTDLTAVAQRFGWPIVADVLSHQRRDQAVFGIDALLGSGALTAAYLPDVVLWFGATPVSAQLSQWMTQAEVWQMGNISVGLDHTRHVRRVIEAPETALVQSLAQQTPVISEEQQTFLAQWQTLRANYAAQLATRTQKFDEMAVVETLDAHLPDGSAIFVANSMPIRDMDDAFSNRGQHLIYANRGANGIDGVLSSAFGMAAATPERAHVLLTGDLTLFHDMNGLMMGRTHDLEMTIVVINNNGGGIFSFLPQAQADLYFEQLFGTPLPLDFAKISALYGLDYQLIADQTALENVLAQSGKHWRLLEIQSEREQNVLDHRAWKQQLGEALR